MNLDPYYEKGWKKKKGSKIGSALIYVIIVIAVAVGVHSISYKEIENDFEKPGYLDCSKCHNRKMVMTQYFERKGNKHPEIMAAAVLKTKQPKLMAAVAVKGEKNTPYTVRRGGYKKRHAGAYQVNERDWGKVPYDATGQALQAEQILETLVAESNGSIKVALNKYGGDKTRKVYAKNILNELNNIP